MTKLRCNKCGSMNTKTTTICRVLEDRYNYILQCKDCGHKKDITPKYDIGKTYYINEGNQEEEF